MSSNIRSLSSILCFLLSFVLSIIVMHYTVGLIPTLSTDVLAVAYFIPLLSFFVYGKLRANRLWLFFLLYLPFTIILGQPSPVFRSWERLLLFAVMFMVCSPALQSDYSRNFRRNCLNISIIICVVLSVGSFFAYFAGINLDTTRDIGDYVDHAGWFSGLTRMSMILAPVSGLSALYLLNKTLKNKSIIYGLLTIPCIGSVLFSASRAGFIATLGGILVMLYYITQRNRKIFKKIITLFVLLAISFPIWESALSPVKQKQEGHFEDSVFDSREGKVQARFAEFVSSPLWGVGFCAQDINGKDYYNKETGTIEPGSSWLALLSMSGIVGFFLFLRLAIASFKIVMCYADDSSFWLLGALVFFFIHMIAEGYIFASGSPTSCLLWLVLGNSCDTKFLRKVT